MEAVWKIEVRDFPAFIIVDDKGNDFFAEASGPAAVHRQPPLIAGMVRSMPPMTGRVIAGRYNLQHPIGRGAMGVVWRARDQILDRDVAVKEVVISSLLGEEERRNAYQRTLREARTAARLSHRGLVAVYDVAEEDGRPWIVMELVPSRSLDQVLTVEGRLPTVRVARIGQQLLSALAAAHLAGVLHRDVKPSNVLIATDRTGTAGTSARCSPTSASRSSRATRG